MRTVRIVRCPGCGSTDAGEDPARSAYDFTYMRCGACGRGELVDAWQLGFDWNVDIELPDDATALPAFVAPLGPGEGLYESMPAAPPKK